MESLLAREAVQSVGCRPRQNINEKLVKLKVIYIISLALYVQFYLLQHYHEAYIVYLFGILDRELGAGVKHNQVLLLGFDPQK